MKLLTPLIYIFAATMGIIFSVLLLISLRDNLVKIGQLIRQADTNTVVGWCIPFVALAFLLGKMIRSKTIGNCHDRTKHQS